MEKIDRETIDEIKEKTSIIKLAKDYFTLTRENGYLGIKDENNKELSTIKIDPESNTYQRFPDRRTRDVIQFVRDTKIEGIESFQDAIVFLDKRIKENTITKELIEEVKSHVSIMDLANEYFSITKEHGFLGIKDVDGSSDFSSLRLYPDTNSYYRFSGKGMNNRDVISFVIDTQIEGITSFKEAVIFLKKRIDPNFNIDIKKTTVKKWNELTPAEKGTRMANTNNQLNEKLQIDDNNRCIIAYLKQTRGIDTKIIYDEIDRGRIAQVITKNGSKALGCIGKDFNFPSLKTAVSVRGVKKDSTFKGDLEGCNYDVGWIISNVERKYDEEKDRYVNIRHANYHDKAKIYCFEGYIDYLSFKTIQKQHGNPMTNDICIVTGSASKTRCIRNFLEGNRNLFTDANITLCFDRDEAGFKAIDKVSKELNDLDMNLKIDTAISYDKDWNDQLLNYPSETNDLAYTISKNVDNIATLSSGKKTICCLYEDKNDPTSAIMFDYKNKDAKIYDGSKEGLNIVFDDLEKISSNSDISVSLNSDYAEAIREEPVRYPNLIEKGNIDISRNENIADRIKDAKEKASNQEKNVKCISKNEIQR